ncbi:conserved hypothetical protein [Leptospira interrogans serovar Manilae]|uniref:Uncharacterized protein n=1 Tax=Leptospira interrogans serovar Manilae TaxID=214675 RepID=A0AAQ1NZA0_LEPIR|nr:hypothetical protein LEP1GSC013_0258 [Leptospira interrogans serovar Valbuzzi str. Duyster]EMN64995.1 hypothetical protein LEP1GSC098_2193 [Leptospira interrogans serovar Grippotyphosa str. UI 08434]ENO70098.1 hypothetical protein LEP1GSC012_1871 [Leptospira interrogans serovar Valbuzzi str. Valbuzzi]SOR62101.1 conserved hypothetical protein [Leptospira interrogans serovar Manilae]
MDKFFISGGFYLTFYLSKILKKTFPIEKEILNTLNLNYLSSKNKTTNLESFRRK